MTIFRENVGKKPGIFGEKVAEMAEAREWPTKAAWVRDDVAELITDSQRDVMDYVRSNKTPDPRLMSALLNLQQATTFLVSVGAQIRPERL